MRFVPLLLLAGCATTAATTPALAPSAPAAPTPDATAPGVPAAPPALDDEAAIARVHAFFAAVDGRDQGAFHALVGAGFFLFEDGHVLPADRLSRTWADSHKAGKPRRTRTCTDQQIRRGPAAIVYVGGCTEHDEAFEDRPPQVWEGWNTVVLVPEDGAWKVAVWQWQRSGIEAERQRWNEAYRRGIAFIKQPNRLLVQSIKGVKPGAALVLAMGQGRNALHLAERGWKVTGVDISDEGIRRAKQAAVERKLELDAVLADIDKYDFGTARWDLVTMLYAGGDKDWIARGKTALKPGGMFVLEFFVRDPSEKGSFIGVIPEELTAAFAGWKIVRNEIVEDTADWGKSKARLIRFVARKP